MRGEDGGSLRRSGQSFHQSGDGVRVQVSGIFGVERVREFRNHEVRSVDQSVELPALPRVSRERNLTTFVDEPIAVRNHVKMCHSERLKDELPGLNRVIRFDLDEMDGRVRLDTLFSQVGPREIVQFFGRVLHAAWAYDVEGLFALVEVCVEEKEKRQPEAMIGVTMADEDIVNRGGIFL